VDKNIEVANIDRLAAAVDTQAATSVTDMLRTQRWRAVAQALGVRSATIPTGSRRQRFQGREGSGARARRDPG
jgi:hypothetical protein